MQHYQLMPLHNNKSDLIILKIGRIQKELSEGNREYICCEHTLRKDNPVRLSIDWSQLAVRLAGIFLLICPQK